MLAASKGRSGALWFLYGLLVFPVALIHALVIETRRLQTGTAGRSPARAEAEMAAKLRQDSVIVHPGDKPTFY